MTKQHHNNKWMPAMYVTYYGILKDVAMEHGYCLAVHGSVTRDFDLVAIPWVDDPAPSIALLYAIRDHVGILKSDGMPWDSREIKPHGRIAYTMQCGAGGYFDISIIEPKSEFL